MKLLKPLIISESKPCYTRKTSKGSLIGSSLPKRKKNTYAWPNWGNALLDPIIQILIWGNLGHTWKSLSTWVGGMTLCLCPLFSTSYRPLHPGWECCSGGRTSQIFFHGIPFRFVLLWLFNGKKLLSLLFERLNCQIGVVELLSERIRPTLAKVKLQTNPFPMTTRLLQSPDS